jgi:hypothetical protein
VIFDSLVSDFVDSRRGNSKCGRAKSAKIELCVTCRFSLNKNSLIGQTLSPAEMRRSSTEATEAKIQVEKSDRSVLSGIGFKLWSSGMLIPSPSKF